MEDVPKCQDSPPSVAERGLAALGAVNDFGVDGSSKFPSSCGVIGPRMADVHPRAPRWLAKRGLGVLSVTSPSIASRRK